MLSICDSLYSQCEGDSHSSSLPSLISARFLMQLTRMKLAHAHHDNSTLDKIAAELILLHQKNILDEQSALLAEAFYRFALADQAVGSFQTGIAWLQKSNEILGTVREPSLFNSQRLKSDRYAFSFSSMSSSSNYIFIPVLL